MKKLNLISIILILAFGQAVAQQDRFVTDSDNQRKSSNIQVNNFQDRKSIPITIIPSTTKSLSGKLSTISTIPFFDDFENGVGNWTNDGFFNLIITTQKYSVLNPDIFPTLVILPDQGDLPSAFDGIGMWWFGETETGTFIGSDFDTVAQFPLNGGTSSSIKTGSLITPPIDLTGVSTAQLNFKTWWEIEGVDVNAFDMMFVEISTDSGITFSGIGQGNINPLNDVDGESWKSYSSAGIGEIGIWISQLFDLTPYTGNIVFIRFRFDTVDNLFNGFRGWFIDNVSITSDALPAPNITNINPSISFGGELVHIDGENFVNNATITIGGSIVSAIISSNLAVVTAPILSPGQYDVTLTNPDGQFDTVVNGLTITSDSPPTLSSIDPNSAEFGTSEFVTIGGTNLEVGATVEIGSILISNLTVVNSTTITGNSPDNLPLGSYNVKVINPDGQLDQLISAFNVIIDPTLIAEITDVPDDQGRWIFLSWRANPLDSLGQITQYGVWELDPDDEWVSLGNVPAIQEDHYTYLAHTFGDSTDEGIFWSIFKVSAHTADPTVFYTSDVDSGYSVDNLAPAAPTGLLALVGEESTIVTLTWDPPVDEDFNYFALYRSLKLDFDPVGTEPYAVTIDTGFVDTEVMIGQTYYYRLSAFDFNGNESEFSNEASTTVITGVGDEGAGLPAEFALSQNYPNPFNPETVIEFALPRSGDVSLVVYNIRGEEVALLLSGTMPAGNHQVTWDASSLASGVYLYRLQAGDFIETRKMVLLK